MSAKQLKDDTQSRGYVRSRVTKLLHKIDKDTVSDLDASTISGYIRDLKQYKSELDIYNKSI